MSVAPIPPGYHTVTPYLIVSDVLAFLEFAKNALGASVQEQITLPDGQVAHAEVKIGDSPVMLGQSRDAWPPLPTMLYLYVPDADQSYERAVGAGAKTVQEPHDEFYGDRSAGVQDPFGNYWWFATHQEEVSSEEIARRMAEIRSSS